MQADSIFMAEVIGKQQQSIIELQVEVARLKGEMPTFNLGQSITTAQHFVETLCMP